MAILLQNTILLVLGPTIKSFQNSVLVEKSVTLKSSIEQM